MARVGLEKLRHGEWQGDDWKLLFNKLAARLQFTLRSWPSRFATPAQAQGWFEWSRFALGMKPCHNPVGCGAAGHLCGPWPGRLGTAGHGGHESLRHLPDLYAAVAIPALGAWAGFPVFPGGHGSALSTGPTNDERRHGHGHAEGVALGTALSWIGVLSTLALMPCFGDFSTVEKALSPLPGFRAAVLIGLVFLTWRMAAINLCFGLTGNKWLSNAPLLVPLLFWTFIGVFHPFLDPDGLAWNWLGNHAVAILDVLLILKCLLACAALRACSARFAVSVRCGALSPGVAACWPPRCWELL